MTIKVDYVSDLHLEFRDYPDFSKEKGGDILILAGDIVTAASIAKNRNDPVPRGIKKFLSKKLIPNLFSKYQHVLMVLGNHEHYRWLFSDTADSICKSFGELGADNLILLDNGTFEVDDWKFYGCTLWSDFMNADPISMWDCGRGMNDFQLIGARHVLDNDYTKKHLPRVFTPEAALDEHRRSIKWLTTNLQNINNKTVVITHHGPTYTSLNKEHVGNGLDGAYVSDLSGMIAGWPQIKYWIHGHTHMNVNYTVGDNCRVLANQRGYRGEPSHKVFSGLKTIELE